MPKPTSDFQHLPDYQEAALGKLKGPVYFGTRTHCDKYNRLRYSRALARNLTAADSLQQYYDDVDANGTHSSYFGRILYPERINHRGSRADAVEWNYEKNKAFWAGIIDLQQNLTLITDIRHYDFLTGTVDELLWLEDNGYMFAPDPVNPTHTLAQSPIAPPPQPTIRDYGNGKSSEGDTAEMLARLNTIKYHVLNLRAMPAAQHRF
jgi:hypothetical protein